MWWRESQSGRHPPVGSVHSDRLEKLRTRAMGMTGEARALIQVVEHAGQAGRGGGLGQTSRCLHLLPP